MARAPAALRVWFPLALLAPLLGACEPRDANPPLAPVDAEPSRAALLEILAQSDPFLRTERLAALLPKLGAEAVAPVRLLLEDATLILAPAEIDLLLRFWASHAPEEAGRWSLVAPLDFRQSAIITAFETWARSDPEGAVQRLAVAGASRPTEAALHALIRGWFAAEVPGLEDHIRDLGVGIARQRALGVFARALIDRDGPQAAMRWAESLADEPWRFKIAAFRQLGSELGKVDLDAAAAWCQAHCEDERFGDNLRARIAHQWAKRDGAGAMAWLQDSPPGAERDEAVRSAFRGWRVIDDEALFAWMSEFGADGLPEWLRPAAGIYAMAISWDHPLEAIDWARRVPDAENRDLAMMTIARRWREADPEGAEAWLRDSELPEALKQKARVFPEGYPGRKGGAPGG